MRMLLTEELKELLGGCNSKLKEKYQSSNNLSSSHLKALIKGNIGGFVKLKKGLEEVTELLGDRPIIGVDGSVNTKGVAYPHYVSLLQALAKSTNRVQESIVKQDIFSPLLAEDKSEITKKLAIARNIPDENSEDIYPQEIAGRIKSSLLARLEVLVAKESITKVEPSLIMLDGSLSRYQIQAEKEWEQLTNLALENNILLVGVIEEIGTHDLSSQLEDNADFPDNMKDMYDRELIFGLLDIGEMVVFDETKNGLKKAFVRSSKDPGAVGIDILAKQSSYLEEIATLVYDLSPEEGRGIPIWLDVVDEEVRISNRMMDMIIDNYLDPSLKKRLFHSKRSDRVY